MLLRSGPFRPSPAEQAEVIDQLLNPSVSLQEVSIRNRISMEDLLLWMEEPEVSERLDRLSSLKAKHTRRQAQWSLDSCVTALRLMVEDYTNTACNELSNPKDPAQAESRRRSARTAQRATWLLWRLCSFDPSATTKPGACTAPTQPSLRRKPEDREPGRPRPGELPERSSHTPTNPRFDQEFRRELEFPGATGQPSSAGRCSPDPEPIPMARGGASDHPAAPAVPTAPADVGPPLPPGEAPSLRGGEGSVSSSSTKPPRAAAHDGPRDPPKRAADNLPPARDLLHGEERRPRERPLPLPSG